jgi:hypothetical protein
MGQLIKGMIILLYSQLAARLGEECLSDEVCLKSDANSDCVQVDYQAVCACIGTHHKIWDKSQGKNVCVPGKFLC